MRRTKVSVRGLASRRVTFVAVVLIAITGVTAAQDIAQKEIDRVKASTVQLKVTGGGATIGTGFVLQADAGATLIVTLQPLVKHGQQLDVVFSGGSSGERVLPGKVVGVDQDMKLGFIRVEGLESPPAPLPPPTDLKLRETMPVFIFGFPTGDLAGRVGGSSGNPVPSVIKASVSSIRKDDYGTVLAVQIDGEIETGANGGPVVDEKGRLVGVGVGKIHGTGISFAIPNWMLQAALQGSSSTQLELDYSSVSETSVEVQVRVPVCNPLGKLKNVTLHYARQEDVKEPPIGKDGQWKRLPSSQAESLEIGEDGYARGKTTMRAPKSGTYHFFFQISVGGSVYSRPLPRVIGFSKAPVAPKLPPPPDGPLGRPNPPPGSPPPGPVPKPPTPPPPGPSTVKPLTIPAPTEARIKLVTGERTIGDLPVKVLKTASNLPGVTTAQIVYSSDGKTFFCYDKNRTITRVRTDTLVADLMVDLTGVTWMGLSKEGLVAYVSQYTTGIRAETIVFDPNTLKPRSRIGHEVDNVPPSQHFTFWATSPSHSVAVAANQVDDIALFDLSKGTRIKTWSKKGLLGDAFAGKNLRPECQSRHMLTRLVFSPDARKLFAEAQGCLVRFGFDGSELRLEEAGPCIASPPQSITLSPDGSWVMLVGPHTFYEKAAISSILVFEASKLSEPAAVLNPEGSSATVFFGPARGCVGVFNQAKRLALFDSAGQKSKEYNLEGLNGAGLAPLGDGSRILIVGGAESYFIQFPRE